jgi:hypothetical protein
MGLGSGGLGKRERGLAKDVAPAGGSADIGVAEPEGGVKKAFRFPCLIPMAQGDNGNFSNWARPGSLHSFFFDRVPSFIASACRLIHDPRAHLN